MRQNILKKKLNTTILLIGCLLFFLSACSINPNIQHRMITWNDIKWQNIQRQQYDYSCGAGALSTLVESYFGDPAPEVFLLEDMLSRLDITTQGDRKTRGFSIQDLKTQAESMGYVAAGVALTPKMLLALKGPVIILINGEDVNHFVVLKGIKHGKAYLADPRRGNIRVDYRQLELQWSGLALVLGKKGFGLPTDHLLQINESVESELVTSGTDTLRQSMRYMQNQALPFSRMIFPVIPSN